MSEEIKPLNLYQKIVQVRMIAEGFSKDGHSYGYSYVTGNQVLSKIKDKMNELNLLLFPSTSVGEHHTHSYKTAKGKDVLDFVVTGEMSYTWINGDNPSERESVTWAYYGQQDDISKAYGSALTYSERYYLLKSLGLPTDEDDPDAKQEKPAQQNQQQSRQSTPPPAAPSQPAQTNTPAAQQNRSSSTTNGPQGMISTAQMGLCNKLKTDKGIPEDEYRAILAGFNGRESIRELTKSEASAFISKLTSYQKGA
jgi:hypothetical protein